MKKKNNSQTPAAVIAKRAKRAKRAKHYDPAKLAKCYPAKPGATPEALADIGNA